MATGKRGDLITTQFTKSALWLGGWVLGSSGNTENSSKGNGEVWTSGYCFSGLLWD
jgi:hypothetical protein